MIEALVFGLILGMPFIIMAANACGWESGMKEQKKIFLNTYMSGKALGLTDEQCLKAYLKFVTESLNGDK